MRAAFDRRGRDRVQDAQRHRRRDLHRARRCVLRLPEPHRPARPADRGAHGRDHDRAGRAPPRGGQGRHRARRGVRHAGLRPPLVRAGRRRPRRGPAAHRQTAGRWARWRACSSPRRSPTAASTRFAPLGHDVDVQLGLSPEELLAAVQGAHALDHPLGHEGHRRGARRRQRPRRRRPGRHRSRQRRRRARHEARRDGRQRTAVEHPLGRRAHDGPAAGAGPQHPAGARRPQGRAVGAQPVGGRRAAGKMLGIIGLGRIGTLVAQRASRVRHAARRLRPVRVGRAGPPDWASSSSTLDELVREADFVTIHAAEDEGDGRVCSARSCWPRPSPGCASSTSPAAASSTRTRWPRRSLGAAWPAPPSTCSPSEPTTESPLFELDAVVVTPHLGASTREAQDKAGDTIAEQVALALAGDFVPFAVNVAAAEATETVRPFLPLAERLGRIFVALNEGAAAAARDRVPGPARRLRHAHPHAVGAKGLFGGVSEEPVSYVNAPQIAAERGVEVRESVDVGHAGLRQPHHRARRRPRRRRHARRAQGRARAS